MLPGQLHPGVPPARAVRSMRTKMRMAGGSRRLLACQPVLDGRVPSAFHLMQEAAAESPGLPLCVDDHGQRRDRPGRSRERPELRRNAGTRLPWRIAPDIGTGLAPPGLAPRIDAMLGEVQRRLVRRLPSNHLAAQDGTSSRARQKAEAVMGSAESGAYAACGSVRGKRQPRRARNQNSGRNSDQNSDQGSEQGSEQSSDQGSLLRPQPQRPWCQAPARRRRSRRGDLGRQDRRQSGSSSIRSSSVRLSTMRWS